MRVPAWLSLIVLLAANTIAARSYAQTSAHCGAAPSASAVDSNQATWLFPIEKLNESLPAWLRFGGEYRNRVEGPSGIGYASTNDVYLFDRFRFNVTIQPKEWLRFHAEVEDARIFFSRHVQAVIPNQDSWTLWQGYAQAGNPKTGWADVVAGRQVLAFGDERVIGPSNWTNVSRTFDVARINLHPAGYNVSLLAASVVPATNAFLHRAIPGNNLYGAYGTSAKVIPKASFEPYVFWRVAPANFGLPETVGLGHLNEVTIGLHVKGQLPAHFDYNTEFDGQTGSLGVKSITAWAGHVGMGLTFTSVAASPRVYIEGNYASGTKNPGSREWNTFDQLYPSNHDKQGFADQIGRRNVEEFRVGAEATVTKKLTFKPAFEGLWLVTSNDNFYANSGAIAVPAHPGASRHVGDEIDLVTEYQMSKQLTFGFGYARVFAGAFLKATTPGQNFTYPYGYMEYRFSKASAQ